MAKVMLIALALGGCQLHLGQHASVDQDIYTRAEIDAMHAETQCKALARTLVQLMRCEHRR